MTLGDGVRGSFFILMALGDPLEPWGTDGPGGRMALGDGVRGSFFIFIPDPFI